MKSNIKLGLFVLSGLLILVVTLYLIGRNKNYFGSNFVLKARFRNVNGLMKGNNVRFSGIQTGTVKDIVILDDTTIEVTLLVDEDTRKYIRKNSFVSIGSEGLMGNKVINILPNPVPAGNVEEGDMLLPARETNVDDMLTTLDETNVNAAIITGDIKSAVKRINNSPLIWGLLDDTMMDRQVKASVADIYEATVQIRQFATDLQVVMDQTKHGKGTLGALLSDTSSANGLKNAIRNINLAAIELNNTSGKIGDITDNLGFSLQHGGGLLPVLLHDTTTANKVDRTLNNVETGTAAFSEDMEALKHHFLFRGYFRKQERKEKKKEK